MSNVIDINKVGNELNEEISNYLAKKLDSDDSSISETVIKPVLVSPEKQEWDVLSDVNGWNKRNDKSEMFGTFTVNPDTVTIHWEKLDPKRIIIKSLPEEFKGSGGTELNPNLAKDTVTIADVAKFITEEYGEDYYIPGIEYLKYLQDTKENWLKDKISKIILILTNLIFTSISVIFLSC
jgi:lipopolysaccharide export LptBFGC system permease protein LptF